MQYQVGPTDQTPENGQKPLFWLFGSFKTSKYSKYSTGLCQDLIEIERDRIDGQLITKHSGLRKVCA